MEQETVQNKLHKYLIHKGFCYTYAVSHSKFKSILLDVTAWSKNRPSDEKRVNEIVKYIKQIKRVQGTICLAEIKEEGLVCYDGNHRREAVMSLSQGSIIQDIIISIIWNTTQDVVIEEFNSINMSISVPLIFLRNDMTTDKELIFNFARTMSKKYPSLVSDKAKCKTPNFNRDVLLDDIVELHELHSGKTTAEIIELIKLMNKCCKKESFGFSKKYGFLDKALSSSVVEKCENSGMWLFCSSRNLDRNYFRKVLKNNSKNAKR